MLTENDVVDAVAAYLASNGYHIASKCSTDERGIDIVAEHSGKNVRLLVEAKGGTSSKKGTPNYGKRFTHSQAKSHVSVAFYYAAMLLEKHSAESTHVALAFPDDSTHRHLVNDIASSLRALGISVFFVNDSLCVTASIPENYSELSSNIP